MPEARRRRSSERPEHRDVHRRRQDDDQPVLPDVTADERDIGWGDERETGRRDERWYREQRPPHHE